MRNTDPGQVPAKGRRRATTLEEVARAAGVSTATVSRVVNGNPRVGREVRDLVETAVRRLGYVPNRSARSLATRRSNTVAFAVLEHPSRLFGDPYFPGIVAGVVEVLDASDLELVLHIPQSAAARHRLTGSLSAGSVDGVLVFGHHREDALPGDLKRQGIPLVLAGRPLDDEEMSYIDVDNVGGGRAATAHLLDGGRRAVGTVAGPQDAFWGIDRLAGYHAARTERGLAPDESLVEVSDFTVERGREAMLRLLGRRPDLDAVFAASEDLALGTLAALRSAGRRVPDDVAIVGFDDLPSSAAADPPLSSVRQPAELLGREMASMLLAQIAAPTWTDRHLVLRTELIVRASSAPAARRA